MDEIRRWEKPVIRFQPAKRIIGFWHIAAVGNGYRIAEEQYAKLKRCGLYDASDKIVIGLIGGRNHERELNVSLRKDAKLDVFVTDNLDDYEFPTIARVWQEAREREGSFLAYYFHTKGASRAGTPNQGPSKAWREYMEYFNLEKWEDCVEILNEYDTCGVELHDNHYSGNFWWATADYLRKLPGGYEYWSQHKTDRHAAEGYLFLARPKAYCFSDFTEDLYDYTLPPERYRRA